MKKTIKKILVVILITSVLLSFTSCSTGDSVLWFLGDNAQPIKDAYFYLRYGFEPGYTGGIHNLRGNPKFYDDLEIHWVETYEEAVTVINGLREHGNKISNHCLISSYENEIVDAKYLFVVDADGVRKQKKGEQWYEREFRAINGIKYYGFLDSVSIEELERSYIEDYRFIEIKGNNIDKLSEDVLSDFSENCTHECKAVTEGIWGNYEKCRCVYKNHENNISVQVMYFKTESHLEVLPENFHEEFIKSLVFVYDEK